MEQPIFLRLALPTPLRRLFDYLPPQHVDCTDLKPGIRLVVPFRNRPLVGVLMGVEKKSDVPYGKLKRAESILDSDPILSPDVFKLCQWAADYYHYSLGEVLSAALPVLLRKGISSPLACHASESWQPGASTLSWVPAFAGMTGPLALNPHQQAAIDTIVAANHTFRTFLLDGVTGSGKTEVYLRAIEAFIQDDKQVLVLVPEISLTPQTIERFRSRFPVPIVALHSSMTDKARLQAWLSAKSGEAKIVIGTRSAIFTSFKNLSLIIVDEEHDMSFKQQDRFRYHARDLAIMRASFNHIPVVLGSATPSLESLLNVKRGRYELLALPERAGTAVMPTYEVIDVRNAALEEGISPSLLSAMQAHLTAGNQVMLFLNRRGFAPVLYCTECAWIVGCKRCDTRMVFHQTPPRLQCHHCDAKRSLPNTCEQCGQASMQPVGLGTQRLEQILKKHFPDVPTIRVDRDSTRKKNSMQALIDQIHAEPKAILLGTQMLAKGHHFPNVTLVGVVDADSGLFSADFRAAEQMGQLLMQVAGRAGREDKRGIVLIQTRHPDHVLLQSLIQQGYATFAQTLLAERETSLLPPYTHFAMFRAEAHAEQSASHFLDMIKSMSEKFSAAVNIMGPVPAIIAKRKGKHCQQLLIKSNQRGAMQQFLRTILSKLDDLPASQPVKWVLDVDPLEVG